jgi:hypothetical protein
MLGVGDARRAVAKVRKGRVCAGLNLVRPRQSERPVPNSRRHHARRHQARPGGFARSTTGTCNTNLVFSRLRDRNPPVVTTVFAECIIGRLEAIIVSKDANSGRKP